MPEAGKSGQRISDQPVECQLHKVTSILEVDGDVITMPMFTSKWLKQETEWRRQRITICQHGHHTKRKYSKLFGSLFKKQFLSQTLTCMRPGFLHWTSIISTYNIKLNAEANMKIYPIKSDKKRSAKRLNSSALSVMYFLVKHLFSIKLHAMLHLWLYYYF